ncbi:universal stress protein [Pseudomonas sp. NCCP-436]|uniref:universal stress protein n=1 Tax=Pseudomonas sp. NCCP-436 TaxID=2842481 RepID=UPI001C7E7109|nr:universal stress protein [Pseudomonas sp. NCCP-436]GIZ11102.1 hypothetical protein NCCP436_05180 [Pseudomonas sp. NCCP-436]
MIKIMVATDLSERSAHAVQRAVQLIRRQGGGEWCLMHAVSGDSSPEDIAGTVRQAESLLQDQAEQLGEQAGSRPSVIVASGEPHRVVVENAQGFGADLLVVGNHGKGSLSDYFVGTTLERMVRSSLLPVLRVVGPVTTEYRHTLLALEPSVVSLQAVRRARELGLLDPRHCDAVSALELITSGVMLEAGLSAEVLEVQSRERHQQLLKLLDDEEVALDSERVQVHMGSPEAVIEEGLRNTGADLLVLGTHAREGVSRLVLGSVASRLLATQSVDALIVPPVR